jgi:YD repeat-containing protein
MKKSLLWVVAPAILAASAVQAAETITYTYDAKGRLTKVVRTGTVNNNVQSQYTHDKANNRKNVTVTGSPNAPPP